MLSKLAISAPVPSRFCTHADAHVEPLVAVDQVVAAAAFDDVAAVAAKDDVAGHEAGVAPSVDADAAEQLLQAVDQGELVSAPPVAPP